MKERQNRKERRYTRTYRADEVVYGIQPVLEAVESHQNIDKIVIRKGLSGEVITSLLSMLSTRGIPVQRVPKEWFIRLGNRVHQGVVAILSAVEYEVVEHIVPMLYEQGEDPLFLLVDGVSDVRNIGAIARSAECAGAHALILPSKGGAWLNGDAVKASAGALLHLPICRSNNLVSTCQYLQNSGVRIIVSSEKEGEYFGGMNLSGPLALVIGDEYRGVSAELLTLADGVATIPMHGGVGSLNVSVAAGILLYAVEAQRHKSS